MINKRNRIIKKMLVFLILLGVTGIVGCKRTQKAENEAEKSNQNNTEAAVHVEKDEKEDIVLFDTVSGIAVVVDHETMKTESYELPKNSSCVRVDEEKLYYANLKAKEDYYQIYAINRENQETILVGEKHMEGELEGAYLTEMESYGGKLHALWALWTDDWTEHIYQESVFVLQQDGTYEETEENQRVYDKMAEEEYQLIRGVRRMGKDRLYTVPLCLERFGEIYVETPERESVVVLDEKGRVKKIVEQPDNFSSIVLLQKNSMLYIDEDKKLILYDWEQNVSKVIMEEYCYIFDDEEGTIYYYVSLELECGIWEYEVYQYPMEKEEPVLLYTVRSVPGIQEYVPGISGFCVKEAQCYYIGTDGAEMAWYRFDADTGKEEMLETDMKLKHYGYSDYGTVTCGSETAVCPNCGREIFSVYAERFILDESFSNAEKINAYLLEDYEQAMDDVKQYEERGQDECERHGEEYFSMETVDRWLKNVEKVGGHYLQVYMAGNWYGGGAHGTPFRDYLLFDMDTGEPVTFQDLYRGSEEEFKELAVEYTVADWKKGENGYFAQTEDDLREEVYESVTMDMLIRFGEEGIVLEYSPYWLGSFADGFIEVPIPYEALDMEENFVK